MYILGAGGHSKQVVDVFEECGISVKGFFDDDTRKIGKPFYRDIIVLGTIKEAHKWIQKNEEDRLFCAMGDNLLRHEMVQQFPLGKFVNCIAPSAQISPSCKIQGTGNYIGHLSILGPSIVIQDFNILNERVFIGHDSIIGSFNHLAPGSSLGGSVTLQNFNLLGTHACILPKLKIPSHQTLGAGAVLTHSLLHHPQHQQPQILVGVPAKLRGAIPPLTPLSSVSS